MLSNWNHNDIILTCLNKIEKPYNEKAEKGDNQLADKKNNQDLETTRRLKILIYDFYCLCLTLQNDASINCLNSYQQSPLAVAAAYNHVAIIEFLLKKGAEIEIKDKDGYTPLLLAASEGKHFN